MASGCLCNFVELGRGGQKERCYSTISTYLLSLWVSLSCNYFMMQGLVDLGCIYIVNN